MKTLPRMRDYILISLFAIPILVSCKPETHNIPYPPAPPADSIVSFLPGIVNDGHDTIDFNAAFSPDGKSFYFTKSLNKRWDIYVSHYQNGKWNKAVKAPFNNKIYSQADPAFGPDGLLYYISDAPKDAADTLRDFDIWSIKLLADGTWEEPVNVKAINTDSTEYYVSFAGNNLYFASSRPGGYGLEDIYVSHWDGQQYTLPVNLGPSINSPYSDHDPSLPKNESFMIYTSVDRKEDGMGEGDLYMSIKDQKGNWSKAEHMGSRFNTPTYEYCGYFSPDDNYFFYSSKRDVKWMRTAALPEKLVRLIK